MREVWPPMLSSPPCMIARCHECTLACIALQPARSRAPRAAEPLLICIAKLSRSVCSCAFADVCMQVEPQALSAYCSGSRVATRSRCTMCSLIEFPVLLLLVIVLVATTTTIATTITTTYYSCYHYCCHCHCNYLLPPIQLLFPLPLHC